MPESVKTLTKNYTIPYSYFSKWKKHGILTVTRLFYVAFANQKGVLFHWLKNKAIHDIAHIFFK